jgi:hypothetical protein
MSSNLTFEVPNGIEINNAADFNLYATLFGIEVPERGRKPFGKLARAINAHDVHHIVDTEYFNAAMADAKSTAPSEYGKRKSELIVVREAAIQAARDAYEADLTLLRTEFGVTETTPAKASGGNAYRVTAKTPVLDKSDPENVTVKRTAPKGDKPGKVRFGPAKSVTVTPAEVRALAPDAGERGRPSKSHTVYAAAVKGGWVPGEFMTVNGWETVMLADLEIETVTVEPVATEKVDQAS